MRTFLSTFSSNVLTRICLLGTFLLGAGCSQITSTPPAQTAQATPKAASQPAEGAFADDAHPLTARESALIAAGLDPAKIATLQRKYLGTLLDEHAAAATAQEAAQKLGLVLRPETPEGASALVALAPMLIDPLRFDNARLALDPVPGATVDALYVNALSKAVGRARLGLIDSIGTRRIESAVPALESLLASADHTTVTAVAEALGRIGGTAALKALDQAKDPLTPVVLNARLSALTKTDAATATKTAGDLYRNTAAPLAQRSAALRSLIAANPSGAVEEIHAALTGPEPKFQAVAIEAVATLPGPVVSASLASRLSGYAPAVQVSLMAALGSRGDGGAVRGLLQASESDQETVRLAAIDALGRLPGTPAVAQKLAALATGNGDEAQAAAASLARLRGMGMDDLVANGAATTAGEDNLRSVYIQALAARNQTAAIPFLLGLRESPVEALRLEALDALRVIAGPRDEDAIIAWAVAAGKAEQTRAVRALITIILRQDDPATRAATVTAAIKTGSAAARLTLMPVLSRIAGPVSAACAGELALGADPAVATAATNELARWPDASALTVLFDVAVHSQAESVRAAAVGGATHYLGQRAAATPALRSTHVRALLALPLDVKAQLALLDVMNLCSDQAALDTARTFLANPATAAAAQDAVDAILSNEAGAPAFTASTASETASRAGDGRLKTYWMAPIVPGEWLRADLHHARPIRKIILEHGNREWDFPANIDVFVSDDPDQPGAVRVQAEGTRYRTEVTLPEGTRGRYLLIRQTGTRSGPWAVAELIVD